jgi:hypothetical protein
VQNVQTTRCESAMFVRFVQEIQVLSVLDRTYRSVPHTEQRFDRGDCPTSLGQCSLREEYFEPGRCWYASSGRLICMGWNARI